MSVSEYKIETVESAPFGQNAYVAWRTGRADALVVDPGFDAPAILEILAREGLTPAAVLLTHGHVDHIAGAAEVKAAFPDAPLVIGRNEAALLGDADANLSAGFGMPLTAPAADRLVDDGERLDLAGFRVEVREVPGHSPGSVVYLLDEFDPPVAIVGDVIFAGSVGRTDLGGDAPKLISGIRARVLTLPEGTLLLPGHGPATTVGAERRGNPFVGQDAGLYGLG